MSGREEPHQHRPGSRLATLVSACLTFAALFAFINTLSEGSEFFQAVDTGTWAGDAERLESCFLRDPAICQQVSKFPFAYAVNSLVIRWLSGFDLSSERALVLIQATFLASPVLVFFAIRGVRDGLKLALLYAVLLCATPLVRFYVSSGALELQSGVALGVLIALSGYALSLPAISRKASTPEPPAGTLNAARWLPTLTNGTLFVACIYKDTVLVLVTATLLGTWALGRLLGWQRESSLRTGMRLWGAGWLAALVTQCAYNWVRYRSVLPVAYLNEAELAALSLGQNMENFLALWLSPNGGFVAFWGLSGSILALFYLMLRARPPRDVLIFTGALCLAGAVGLSRWWAAFGWDAWGARLLIPFGLAALIGLTACLDFATKGDARVKVAVARRLTLITASAVLLLAASAYSVGFVWLGYTEERSNLMYQSLFSQAKCLTMLEILQEPNKPEHLEGLKFWRSEPYWNCVRSRFATDPASFRSNESSDRRRRGAKQRNRLKARPGKP